MRSFQLGLYDPVDDSHPVKFISLVYRDTPHDHQVMRLTISQYNKWAEKRKGFAYCLGIFPAQRSRARKGDAA
jgi:hypothetical protein